MATENDTEDNALQAQYNAAFNEAAPDANAPADALDAGDAALDEDQEQAATAQAEAAAEPGETDPAAAQTDAKAAEAAGDDDQTKPADKAEPTAEEVADAALEVQRLKSWEGRLKKKEAEQKARDEADDAEAARRLAASTGAGVDEVDPATQKAVGAVAEQVADGTLTVAQAMQQISADFGEDFVKMIKVMVASEAAEVSTKAAASVKTEVDSLAKSLAAAAEQAHFEKIEAAHPDFNDVRMDPAFAAFVEAADPENQRIASSGNAREVIKLVKTFKASQSAAPVPTTAPAEKAKPAAVPEPDGVDAATGVRSGGLQLPAEKVVNDDYDSAFAEAAAMGSK
jgi:hypothetical protein